MQSGVVEALLDNQSMNWIRHVTPMHCCSSALVYIKNSEGCFKKQLSLVHKYYVGTGYCSLLLKQRRWALIMLHTWSGQLSTEVYKSCHFIRWVSNINTLRISNWFRHKNSLYLKDHLFINHRYQHSECKSNGWYSSAHRRPTSFSSINQLFIYGNAAEMTGRIWWRDSIYTVEERWNSEKNVMMTLGFSSFRWRPLALNQWPRLT